MNPFKTMIEPYGDTPTEALWIVVGLISAALIALTPVLLVAVLEMMKHK